MKHRIIQTVVWAIGLLLFAGLSLAADAQPQKAGQASAAHGAKTPAKKPAKKAPAPQVTLVDINSASREELKKLPGIDDAQADKIIAGRPYLTKAHLQTHNIVSPLVYQGLREHVVARQKDATFAKAPKK
jgi:competence protein ComEA